MDLLALVATLRRHKLIVLLVLLIAAAGNGYVAFGIPPQYESQAQFVLIAPPAPPSDAAIERDPDLAKINTNNPYLRLPNPVVVVEVLAQRVSGDAVRRELIAEGADRNYTISSTNAIGSGLVISIVGTGGSAQAAGRTLELVTTRMQAELRTMQKVDGADDRYLFQALPINPPTEPIRKVTGTFRSLIAVSAACVVLLFGLVSVADAIGPRRSRRRTPGGMSTDTAHPAAGPAVGRSTTDGPTADRSITDGPTTDNPATGIAAIADPAPDGRRIDSLAAGDRAADDHPTGQDESTTRDISPSGPTRSR